MKGPRDPSESRGYSERDGTEEAFKKLMQERGVNTEEQSPPALPDPPQLQPAASENDKVAHPPEIRATNVREPARVARRKRRRQDEATGYLPLE